MALQLTFDDPAWGTVTNSIHVITGIANSNARDRYCHLTMEVYRNASALGAGNPPIDKFTVFCVGDDFDAVTGATITSDDVGTTLRVAQLKRAESWLLTQDKTKTQKFDYTTATIV